MTTVANAMLVRCMGINSSSTSLTINSPAGMTGAWDLDVKRQVLSHSLQAVFGPTGGRTWTLNSSRTRAGCSLR